MYGEAWLKEMLTECLNELFGDQFVLLRPMLADELAPLMAKRMFQVSVASGYVTSAITLTQERPELTAEQQEIMDDIDRQEQEHLDNAKCPKCGGPKAYGAHCIDCDPVVEPLDNPSDPRNDGVTKVIALGRHGPGWNDHWSSLHREGDVLYSGRGRTREECKANLQKLKDIYGLDDTRVAMDGPPFVPEASGKQIQIHSSDTDALTEMFGDEAPAVAEIMKKAEARMADEPITRKAND